MSQARHLSRMSRNRLAMNSTSQRRTLYKQSLSMESVLLAAPENSPYPCMHNNIHKGYKTSCHVPGALSNATSMAGIPVFDVPSERASDAPLAAQPGLSNTAFELIALALAIGPILLLIFIVWIWVDRKKRWAARQAHLNSNSLNHHEQDAHLSPIAAVYTNSPLVVCSHGHIQHHGLRSSGATTLPQYEGFSTPVPVQEGEAPPPYSLHAHVIAQPEPTDTVRSASSAPVGLNDSSVSQSSDGPSLQPENAAGSRIEGVDQPWGEPRIL
jgi:hypothetical protein